MNVNARLTLSNITAIKGGIMINVGVSAKIQKKHAYQKYYIWNPATFICERCEYLVSTINNLEITCDEMLQLVYWQMGF